MSLDLENINLGTTTGDKTGDGAKTAGGKINRNFQKVKDVIENPNQIIEQKGFGLAGQNITLNSGWVWRINNDNYTNPVNVVENVPLAASGQSRFDLIVATTSNTFMRVAGQEAASDWTTPLIPANTILIVKLLVNTTVTIAQTEEQAVYLGAVEPTSTPTGTGSAFWTAIKAGTYTNFGGVVVAANSMAIISRNAAGAFSISQSAVDLTNYLQKTDNIKIQPWTAKVYASGDQVNHLGKDWVSNSATVVGDVPGASSKWVERLSGYLAEDNLKQFLGDSTTDVISQKGINDIFTLAIENILPKIENWNKTDAGLASCKFLEDSNDVYEVSGASGSLGLNVKIPIQPDFAVGGTYYFSTDFYKVSGTMSGGANAGFVQVRYYNAANATLSTTTLGTFNFTTKTINNSSFTIPVDTVYVLFCFVPKGTTGVQTYRGSYIQVSKTQIFGRIPQENYRPLEIEYSETYTGTAFTVNNYPEKINTSDNVFVAKKGNNTYNNGSKDFPFATISEALKCVSENGTIHVAPGDYIDSIDLSKYYNNGKISIIGERQNTDGKIRLLGGFRISTATLVSGQTNVYEVINFSTLISATLLTYLGYSDYLMYQHLVQDTNTSIFLSDKHPLQQNRTNRCDSYAMRSKLSLAEVISSAIPCYWYDSANNKLYFRASSTNLITNPIVLPFGEKGITGFNTRFSVKMRNIHFYYQNIDLSYAYDTELVECSSRYVVSNSFFLFGANDVKLIRCEAARAQLFENGESNLGDGFNSSNYATYTMIDCWSHDHSDDGVADHIGSKNTIIGGLFENNNSFGKGSGGGVVPTSNCVVSIYNATMRNNEFGVMSNGTSSVNAFGCIAKGNKSNYAITGAGQSMILKDCISLNAVQLGYSNSVGSFIELISCKDFGSLAQKNGAGTFNIIDSNVS